MKVTVFLEGRPGHEKQSLAIAQALRDIAGAEVRQITLKPSTLLGQAQAICRLLLLPGGGCDSCPGDIDLLIGTGSKTHVALLACKKRYGIPVVTCMAPEPYLRPWFDLCCVPRHDRVREAKNIFLTDGPPVMPGPLLPRDAFSGLILIGGVDQRSHLWNSIETAAQVRTIARNRPDIHWKVSSSPRTPADCVELLCEAAEMMENLSFFHFRNTPRGWVEEQYARATYVWVTADSVSMIYEAVTAGCKVGILPVAWKKPCNKFQYSIDCLEKLGRVAPFSEKSGEALEQCIPGDFNEAGRCAAEIITRFFSG